MKDNFAGAGASVKWHFLGAAVMFWSGVWMSTFFWKLVPALFVDVSMASGFVLICSGLFWGIIAFARKMSCVTMNQHAIARTVTAVSTTAAR